MIAALQEAAESLETPVDMLMRFCESVRDGDFLLEEVSKLIILGRAAKQHCLELPIN